MQAILASALAVAQGELCSTLAGNAGATALAAASSPAAGADGYAAAGALSYAFRSDNTRGGALPFGIDDAALAGSGALAPASVLQPAVLLPLAALANWPGFALAPPDASTALSLAWMFSPACGGAGPGTVLALARDDCGLAGNTAVKVAMTPSRTTMPCRPPHRRAGHRHGGHAVGRRGAGAWQCACRGGGGGGGGGGSPSPSPTPAAAATLASEAVTLPQLPATLAVVASQGSAILRAAHYGSTASFSWLRAAQTARVTISIWSIALDLGCSAPSGKQPVLGL